MTFDFEMSPQYKAAAKSHGLAQFVTGAAISAPCTLLSIFIMQKHFSFHQPWLWMLGILALGVLDFLAAILLEPMKRELGSLTLPALLGSCGMVLFYVLAQTLNRYIEHLGYDWLLPFVIASLGLCYAGIFLEKNAHLKCYLALNGLALTVLWCLGAADKVALPF